MSTPPNNPYAHNPDPDDESEDSSGSGVSPYGPASGSGGSSAPGQFHHPSAGPAPYGDPHGQLYGQPYGQQHGSPMPYGGYQPQQPGYPNAPYTGGGMGWGANTSKNYMGGWALGLGLSWLVCCFPGAIGGIIFGALGRKAANDGLATNKSMATTGMIMGIIGVALWGAIFVLNIAVGAWELEF